MFRKVALFMIFMSLFAVVSGSGINDDIYFRHLSSYEGFPSNASVYSVAQDARGFMWMATNRGLLRFDGSSTRMFDNVSSSSTNTSRVILAMESDANGRFWMRTTNGIKIFDVGSGRFSDFTPKVNGKEIGSVDHFRLMNNGRVIIITHKDVYECDTLTGACRLLPTSLKGVEQRYAPAEFCDSKGIIWLGYPNNGIYRLDVNRGPQFVGNHDHTPVKFYDYGTDSLMICTLSRGLWIMSKRTGESRKVGVPGMPDGNIFAKVCCRIDPDKWWIGTETGIYIMKNGCITQHLQHIEGDALSLSDNRILSMCMDADGGIWVGTEKGGVNYCQHSGEKFRRIYPLRNPAVISGNHVTAMAKGLNGDLWIGTDDGGLSCISTFKGQNSNALIPDYLKSVNVTALLKRNNEMWVATYTKGLFVVDLQTMKVRNYKKNSEEGCITNNEDNCMCLDSKGRVWIGTTTDLFLFDDSTERFAPVEGLNDWITDVVADDKDRIWGTTHIRGLFCYDSRKGKLKWYSNKANKADYICRERLSCLYIDHENCLWVGSEEDGLCRMNLATGACKRMGEKDGIPSGGICSVVEDADGRVWVSSADGLALIDVNKWCVEHVWKKGFWPFDGEFCPRSRALLSSGELCWGGTDGLLTFYPQAMSGDVHACSPVLTDVFFPMDSNMPLDDVLNGDNLEIPYSKSSFGVRLSALDYENENGGLFEYRLAGSRSDGWMRCIDQSVAQWSDLPPGRYELYARYAVDGRTWSADTLVLHIHVLPPWWRTWWAYMLYAAALFLCAWLAWRWERRRRYQKLLRQQSEWEEKRKEETMEARMKFFTNVAHEIRTPVTLIKASVEQMTEEKNISVENRERLSKNVDSLGRLVNELLEFRRVESEVNVLGRSRVDLARVVRMTLDVFNPAVVKRNLVLDDRMADSRVLVWADEQALSTVMTNILGNAVKYASSVIKVVMETRSDKAVLKVSNDGKPIPESVREHIFEPFVKGTDDESSTGIGLSLVYLLMKRMNGDVTVECDDDTITFMLTLQVAEEYSGMESETGEKAADYGEVVLIVEDNLDMRNYLVERFSEKYKTLSASNGEEAWAMLESKDVELIVSDVMMPKMDGFALCTKVKTTIVTSHIPVLLLTAKTTKNEHVKGYELGADAYVDKPFSINELTAIAESLLRNRRLQKHRVKMLNIVGEEKGSADEEKENCFNNQLDNDFISNLNSYINEHLIDEDFNIDTLAESMNMSRSNFHRKIKALLDSTPGEYVHIMRMKRAAILLSSGTYRVGEVCEMVGFRSVAHFTRVFQKEYGMTPKKYMTTHLTY